jgi:hypothetical protein
MVWGLSSEPSAKQVLYHSSRIPSPFFLRLVIFQLGPRFSARASFRTWSSHMSSCMLALKALPPFPIHFFFGVTNFCPAAHELPFWLSAPKRPALQPFTTTPGPHKSLNSNTPIFLHLVMFLLGRKRRETIKRWCWLLNVMQHVRTISRKLYLSFQAQVQQLTQAKRVRQHFSVPSNTVPNLARTFKRQKSQEQS